MRVCVLGQPKGNYRGELLGDWTTRILEPLLKIFGANLIFGANYPSFFSSAHSVPDLLDALAAAPKINSRL